MCQTWANTDSKNPLPSSWITSHAHPIIEPVSFLCSSFSSCLSCLSCLSMFPNTTNRFNGNCPYSPKAMKIRCFTSYDPPARAGAGLAGKREFPKGCTSAAISEKLPGAHPPPHQPSPGGSASATPPQGGSDCPGSAGVRPHPLPLAAAELQCDAAGSHPVGGNPIGQAEGEPGMAPFPVDSSGGDGRACARLGAGGTPALPASLHPMTSSHQRPKIAEVFWCRLWLREVHLSSGLFALGARACLFVSIGGSSSLSMGRFSSNDPPRRMGRGRG